MCTNLHFINIALLIRFLFFFSLPSHAIISRYNNVTDQLALLEFKSKIIDDPLGVLSLWNSSSHFCKWYGVQCGRRHERVTVLDLSSLKLSGSISPHIGNLSFLRELYLQNNSFTQEIPPQIGHLRRLQVLYLYNNSIGGNIPGPLVSNLSNLVYISLGNNKFGGEIPFELGSLLNLKGIYLSGNMFIGSLPPSLGNLSSLEDLNLNSNKFRGDLPHTFGKLKNLKEFTFGGNELSGNIPSSINNMSSIEIISAGGNNFKGNLPLDLDLGISNLPNLYFFGIGGNHFTGTIPSSVSNASNLQVFQISINQFSGAVPSFQKLFSLRALYIGSNHLGSGGNDDDLRFLSTLTNATNLKHLRIGDNNFGGNLPQMIGNLSKKLEIFVMEENQLVGDFPSEIYYLESLQGVWASWNRFGCTIPHTIGNIQSLQILSLQSNAFVASIPSSIGNLTNLLQLDLSRNKLEGNIPSSIGNCKKLTTIDLSQNNLTGSIPSKIFQLSSLSIYFGLPGNHLTGSLPIEVGNLKNLQVLDLENNMLSGNLPATLGSCVALQFVYISNNNFQGPIPSSLSSLRGIEELNVSHNNLSEKIPEFLISFNLTLLDLSYNDFEGTVPTEGVFKNASATSIGGNKRLCGGIPDFGLPECTSKRPKNKITFKLKIIILVLSVGIGLLLPALFFSFLCFYLKRKKRGVASTSFGKESLNLSYQTLLKATNGFSSDNLIGTGSFGSAYKGILDPEGNVIAVKVLNLQHRGALKSFAAECAAIRNIRHRNLVKVLTACSSIDYNGNDFKALVYEFMSNGSLDDWLHPITGTDEAPRILNAIQRLNIVIDVACAIEYLHLHCEAPIIHCDLKPSNILLDDELTAHVSDFGLVRFLSNDMIESTNQFSSLGLRGTIGYCPPEYGVGSEISTTGDIFSFGILLLEIFTGKQPTDDMFKGSLSLHKFVSEALPEHVTQVVDLSLLQINVDKASNSDEHSMSRRHNILVESLISIFKIGISCSVESPQERMKIDKVVAHLSSIRKMFLDSQLF